MKIKYGTKILITDMSFRDIVDNDLEAGLECKVINVHQSGDQMYGFVEINNRKYKLLRFKGDVI